MPIGFDSTKDDQAQAQQKDAEPDPSGASWNPFTVNAEEKKFLSWLQALTADGHTLTADEFQRVVTSYKSFGGLARYSISSRAIQAYPWFNAVEHGDYSLYQSVQSDG